MVPCPGLLYIPCLLWRPLSLEPVWETDWFTYSIKHSRPLQWTRWREKYPVTRKMLLPFCGSLKDGAISIGKANPTVRRWRSSKLTLDNELCTNKLNAYTASPWANHTGWLGVKHQYLRLHNICMQGKEIVFQWIYFSFISCKAANQLLSSPESLLFPFLP